MLHRQPYLPRFMAGGPGNPLGARAVYLADSMFRIHGTNAPETIGRVATLNVLYRAAANPLTVATDRRAASGDARHDIIGNAVAFVFVQFLAKSAHKFARAPQRECNGEAQHVPASAPSPPSRVRPS